MRGFSWLNEEIVASEEGILVHLELYRHLLTKYITFRIFLLCRVDDSGI